MADGRVPLGDVVGVGDIRWRALPTRRGRALPTRRGRALPTRRGRRRSLVEHGTVPRVRADTNRAGGRIRRPDAYARVVWLCWSSTVRSGVVYGRASQVSSSARVGLVAGPGRVTASAAAALARRAASPGGGPSGRAARDTPAGGAPGPGGSTAW